MDNWSLFRISAVLIAIITVRFVLEFLVAAAKEQPTLGTAAALYSEIFVFFVAVFLFLVLLVSRFAGENPRKSALFILKFFWIIIFSPVLDFLLFGKTRYYYGDTQNLPLDLLTSYIFDPGTGIVQLSVAFVITMACAIYVARKSHSLKKGAVLLAAAYIFTALIATPPGRFPAIEAILNTSGYYISIFFYSYISIALLFLIFGIHESILIFRNMRPSRAFYFSVLALLPYVAYQGSVLFAAAAFLAVFFGWNAAAAINDITDIEIDKISNPKRKNRSSTDVMNFSCMLLASSILLAAVMGVAQLVIVLVMAFISFSYSIPPLRFRRFIFSNLFIGTSAALSFFLGVLSQTYVIDSSALIFIFLCFAATTLASFTKDLKDFHGDKATGIKTLFSVFGRKRGKLLSEIFLAAAFLLPAAFIEIKHMAVLVPLAILALALFHKKENVVHMVVLTLVALVYSFAVLYGFVLTGTPQQDEIRVSMDNGIDFLYKNQLDYGEFRMLACSDYAMNSCEFDSSLATTYILHSLSRIENERTAAMKEKALRFIISEKINDTWRYWSSKNSLLIDPDVDITSLTSFVLKNNGILINNSGLILENKNEQGLFYTFIIGKYPGNSSFIAYNYSNDVDCAVNSNAMLYTGSDAKVCSFINDALMSGKKCSVWYPDLAVFYMVSNAFENNITCLGESRNKTISKILGLRKLDGSFGTPTDTALAVNALMNFGYGGNEISSGIAYLMKSQLRDGSWKRGVFFYGIAPFYGSEELTTALALEALQKYADLHNM